jgi:serine/threonine-protein kinase
MDADRYRRAKAIVLEALALSPVERTRLLDARCDGDAALRQEVESLLSQEAAVAPALDRPLGSQFEAMRASFAAQSLPRRLGKYELLEHIGAGGMGEVYRAREHGPIEREVAVKLARAGATDARFLARFEWERRSLARMDHPHIAKVFDTGADEFGRPYVVMELAEGESILVYADRERLGLRERILLFLKVCRAVQHAHERSVLHRDLKPSNILVRTRDAAPAPTIIDFGIAKALDDSRSDDLDLTLVGQRVGTPAYMSPEQLRGDSDAVDTRSDVYALGIVLYELLAGRHPFAAESANERELLQHRTAGALAPSTALSEAQALAELAGQRNTTPGRLRRALRGDLDTICLKALRPERERRYASVAHLGEDLERYLDGRPVLARPDSLPYRTSKAIRRHPIWTGAAVALTLFVVAGLVGLGYHAERLQRERDRARSAEREAQQQAQNAEQVADFLQSLFTGADPVLGGEGELSARDLLLQGSQRLRTELADQPLLHGRMLRVIGASLHGLAAHAEAERALREGIALLDSLAMPESLEERALLRTVLGNALHDQGNYAAGESISTQAVALYRQLEPGGEPRTVVELSQLAIDVQAQGRLDPAIALFEESIEMGIAVNGPDDPEVAYARNMLGYVQYKRGEYRAALSLMEQALASQVRDSTTLEVDLGSSLNNLGGLQMELGDYASAERYLTRAESIYVAVYREEHPAIARAYQNLGRLYTRTGRMQEGLRKIEAGYAMNRRVLGPENPYTSRALASLAEGVQASGYFARAERLMRENLAFRIRTVGDEHASTRQARRALGELLLERGDLAEAASLLERVLRELEQAFPSHHPEVLTARLALARLQARRGDRELACSSAHSLLGSLREIFSAQHPDVEAAAALVAECTPAGGR